MLAELFASFTSSTVLTVVLVLIVGILWYSDDTWRKLPPGPTGLPFVGYLPFLRNKPYLKLMELKKKYGPVYSLRLGSENVVILADYLSMKEAFNKDAFIARPPNMEFHLNKETLETGALTHLPWKKLKRFSLHVFRDLGLGRTLMEAHIGDEIQDLLERFEKEGGRPITPKDFLAPSTSNNISSLVFGKRRKFDDPKRIMLDDILRRVGKLLKTVAWLQFFPLLKKLFQILPFSKHQQILKTLAEMNAYIKDEVEEHKKSLDPNNVRDYIDGFLLEMEKTKNEPDSIFILPVLEDIVSGFFFAGSETVRSTVDWLMLVSAGMPEVQKKVQAEIDEVIGTERFPSRADHHNMPYTEAVIMEVLRWRGTLPISFPRYTIEDTTVGTYFIPKNVQVIPVSWAAHYDTDLWGEDVEDFKPERFLSKNGKKIQKPEYYIPFSIGKRSCPGESLAYMELFMYITAILQKFHLRLPEGEEPDFKGFMTIGMQTTPYTLCLDLRR